MIQQLIDRKITVMYSPDADQLRLCLKGTILGNRIIINNNALDSSETADRTRSISMNLMNSSSTTL